MENDKRNYREVLARKNVMVKVPKEGLYMTKIGAHEFKLHGKTVSVDSYWKNGLSIPSVGRRGVILNRLFYGIEKKNLGKKIVARVEVIQKITRDGREYLMLNITKASSDTKATSDLKFPTNGSGNIPIPGTDTKILFDLRRPVEKR